MRVVVLGALAAVSVAGVVLHLVMHRKLLVKYAALWLVVSVLAVIFGFIPEALQAVSDVLGFEVPANLLFFAAFLLLMSVTIQLSVELTKISAQVQRLAEEVAVIQVDKGDDERRDTK